MYLQLNRGKTRETDAAHQWFIGAPRLIDRWAIRWMTPASTNKKSLQNVWFSFYMMVTVLIFGGIYFLTRSWVFTIIQWLFIALQISIIFVTDRGAHRSLPTLVAEWWLRRCLIVKLDKSQALIALSRSYGDTVSSERTHGFLAATKLTKQIDAYLLDPETREWEAVLDTAPVNGSIEDEQITDEVREQLVDRARAVLAGDWPPAAITSSVDDAQVTTWRLRATKATGDANWQPTIREN
ncbi:MAG: hypothetical protein ABIP74_02080 [Candidatus Saccharimonas sp.]